MRREHNIITETPPPAGYRWLEYLQSTGTQYIKSGFTPTLNSELYFDFQITEAMNSNMVMGQIQTYDRRMRNAIVYYSSSFALEQGVFRSQNWSAYFQNTYRPSNLDRNQYYHCKEYDTFRDATYQNDDASSLVVGTARELYIFARNKNGSVDPAERGKLKLFRCWFKDGNTHIDYYPALRLSDSRPGLYDIVNNVFRTNAGTGEFLYN